MRFLGLSLGESGPDAQTIWLFRERLIPRRAIETLFDRFDQAVARPAMAILPWRVRSWTRASSPRRSSATLMPRKRRSRLAASRRAGRLRQKDRDARWAVKFSKAKPCVDGIMPVDIAIPTFGYQNHISTDRRHSLIRKWAVTGCL